MGILYAFTPFILFALLASVTLSMSLALWVALAAAFTIAIRDFAHSKSLRAFDIGGVFLFGLLALYLGFVQPGLKSETVRLVVDCALLLIALGSIALRNPFTSAYAREFTPKDAWRSATFIRANYIITALWAAAFAATGAADAVANFDGRFPLSLDTAVGLAVLGLAVVVTARYRFSARAPAGPAAAPSREATTIRR
jgi:hypothetical protein